MAYTYPGQAFDHTLVPLKGWYRESALDVECTPSSNVNINSASAPVTSGLCIHGTNVNANTDVYGGQINGPGTVIFEMGCGPTHGVPYFTWPNSTDPDISNPGTIPGDPVYGSTAHPPDWIPVLPTVPTGTAVTNMVALVGTGGYELETTEYDTAQTYVVGQPIRAVTSNTLANAGKVTNQKGPVTGDFNSSGVVQFVGNTATVTNWDTIVGWVSRQTYTNANRRSGLSFYTDMWPGNR
jgi:hypothetical protein